jgi:hypothetical protein
MPVSSGIFDIAVDLSNNDCRMMVVVMMVMTVVMIVRLCISRGREEGSESK